MAFEAGPEVLVSADPGAGVDLTYTFLANYRITSLAFLYVTDGTVSTRTVRISIANGANTYFRVSSGTSQTATLTMGYGAYCGAPFVGSTLAGANMPLPATGLLVKAGDVMTITAVNKQAGDDFSPVTILAEQF